MLRISGDQEVRKVRNQYTINQFTEDGIMKRIFKEETKSTRGSDKEKRPNQETINIRNRQLQKEEKEPLQNENDISVENQFKTSARAYTGFLIIMLRISGGHNKGKGIDDQEVKKMMDQRKV
jgi:trehalose-6-phosphatase